MFYKNDPIGIDLFIEIVRRLTVRSVVSLCSVNKKHYHFGTNYPKNWKRLIDHKYRETFRYEEKLNPLLVREKYNYRIYVHFFRFVEPVRKLIHYYRWNDEIFYDNRFNGLERLVAFFFMRNVKEMKELQKDFTYDDHLIPFINVANGQKIKRKDSRLIFHTLGEVGCIFGLKRFYKENPRIFMGFIRSTLDSATTYNHLETVQSLINLLKRKEPNTKKIQKHLDNTLVTACRHSRWKIGKFLLENGANIHAFNNQIYETIVIARPGVRFPDRMNDQLEFYQAIINSGGNINHDNGGFLLEAYMYNNVRLMIFLLEKGTSTHALINHTEENPDITIDRMIDINSI